MIKVDTSSWREFKLSDVFILNRGRRLTRLNQTLGSIAYISSTKENNGIDNYITPPDYMKIYQNAMTINNSGSVGYCFYHPYKFVASDHCTVIRIKDKAINLNQYISLFLKVVLEKMCYKYNFGREISDKRISQEFVNLPAINNSSGEYQPDWQFMEDFIKSISKKVDFGDAISGIDKLQNTHRQPDISDWREFDLDKIFEIIGTKSHTIIQIEGYGAGEYPYVVTSSKNNGVQGYYGHHTENANVLTIDSATVGSCFYQERPFSASDHVEKLIPKFEMNVYISMFLKTVMEREKFRYGYGRKFSQIRIKQSKIKLPAIQTSAGTYQPDWQFMENYVKSLPYSSHLQ